MISFPRLAPWLEREIQLTVSKAPTLVAPHRAPEPACDAKCHITETMGFAIREGSSGAVWPGTVTHFSSCFINSVISRMLLMTRLLMVVNASAKASLLDLRVVLASWRM